MTVIWTERRRLNFLKGLSRYFLLIHMGKDFVYEFPNEGLMIVVQVCCGGLEYY